MNASGYDEMRGSVAKGAFQLQHAWAGAIALEPLVGNGGTRDIAAQAFEFRALIGATAHRGNCVRPRGYRILSGFSHPPEKSFDGA